MMQETRPLPNSEMIIITRGVQYWLEKEAFLEELFLRVVKKQFSKEPDTCFDGGNDKYFFSFTSRNQKFFAVANEVGGLTVMLPEEY